MNIVAEPSLKARSIDPPKIDMFSICRADLKFDITPGKPDFAFSPDIAMIFAKAFLYDIFAEYRAWYGRSHPGRYIGHQSTDFARLKYVQRLWRL